MNLKCTVVIKYLNGLFFLFILAACGHQKETKVVDKIDRVAIEVILEDDATRDSLMNQLSETLLERYAWKNHVVLFGSSKDTLGISELISQSGITLKTKRYNSPLYVFDKATHCGDASVQKPWKNYLLTANLVIDSVLQQEYITYHNNQFKEWPEVAQGFCNADFQQLLVYRNGRQLMLVISIPSNKTLDELNPKTVENNPRMIEWNHLMGKYQEGIQGTSKGETWVFLDEVD